MTISVQGNGVSFADLPNSLIVPPYQTTRAYLATQLGAGVTATNANTLTTDTIYGVIAPINSRVTLTGMGFRTSSTNASVGAAVKFGIYALDPVTNLPTNLLAQTTSGVSITDLATTTPFSATFSSAVTLNPGNYLFCLLATTTTTAARSSVISAVNSWNTTNGATSVANLFNTTVIMGYKSADGAAPYASNFPATFGTPTAITNLAASSAQQLVALAFVVQ